MRCGLAEIDLAGRAHAFDVSAVRRKIQVSFKNFVFRVMPLEFEGANNLNELSAQCPGRQMVAQAGHLHRDGRGAAVRAARPPIKSRAHQCDRVNSRVMPIIFVFKLEGRIDQRERNVWQRSPHSEFLIGSQSDAKQFPVAIANALGKRNAFEKWRLWERKPNCSNNRAEKQWIADCGTRIADRKEASSRQRNLSAIDNWISAILVHFWRVARDEPPIRR